MKAVVLLLMVLDHFVSADDNGLGRTPPMGWRSWNFYQCTIDQHIMESSFRLLADRSRLVDGIPTSLVDLGYVDAGLDDCWQLCGQYGPLNYTYHNASGWPQVNFSRFPSMAGMVDVAHSFGLRAGFYSNNCKCKDHCSTKECFESDVKATRMWGFDSIKLDGCGQEKNVSLWRHYFNITSDQPVMIENCHNGPNIPWGTDPSSCPFHMYRSSTDIAPCWGSILANLQTVVPLAEGGLSYPGCWAYPDMLEVMQTNAQGRMPLLTTTESRSHFGLWAIVSSPLILGFDLTNATLVDAAWPFITNKEVIAINQVWNGFPGSIFYSSPDNTSYAPCGWWLPNCSFPSVQYLYKPQPNNKMAVLLMNNADSDRNLTLIFKSVPKLSSAASYNIRDVWRRIDLGVFSTSYTAPGLGSRDSAFLILTPASQAS